MSERQAVMVRVYLLESDHGLQGLLKCLHDEVGVCGVTVMRGIEGFGASGRRHSASLLDLSLDLPLVLEFFDQAEKVQQAIEHINSLVKPGHIVSWPVTVEVGEEQC